MQTAKMKTEALSWGLILPALLLVVIFVFFPTVESFFLSLFDVDPYSGEKRYIGFENYEELFHSTVYWENLKTSFLFSLYTVIPSVGISLFLAYFLQQKPFFQSIFRVIFLFPVAISSAMAAMLWIFLFNPISGHLNYLLSLLEIAGPNWLGDPNWALPAVAITTIWKEIGFNLIFFLAGFTAIPNEMKEAARVDGANAKQTLFKIILPLLSPTIFFVSVVSFIHSFESFGQIHILTGGGPYGKTSTLVYQLYLDAFIHFRRGFASAEAVILFLIMALATAIQFYVAKKRVHYR